MVKIRINYKQHINRIIMFQIYSSEDRKVMNSAEEFAKTMFGDDFRTKVPIERIPTNSSLNGVKYFSYFADLAFYPYILIFILLQFESCPGMINQIQNSEAMLFQKSPEFKTMVSQISKRLGFLDNITDSKYKVSKLFCLVIKCSKNI